MPYQVGQVDELGILLNRNEAIGYLKGVLDICRAECSPDKILFEETKDRVIVRLKGSDLSGQSIREVAQKLSFDVKEENGEYIISKQKQEIPKLL